MTIKPEITFSAQAAHDWLTSPDAENNSDLTVAESLCVSDEDNFGFCAGNFAVWLDSLVARANSAGHFGADVLYWPTYDESEGYNGGIVTVDFSPLVRLASVHLDLDDLTTNRAATGVDAAVAVLAAVANEADSILRAAKGVLT